MKAKNPRSTGKANSPWPFLAQQGFGLLEVLTAILVFVLLAYVGTRAFHGVVDNHRAANQVSTMNDLVTATAEELSAIGVSVLTQGGSKYLQWSEPAVVGHGPMYYRYRIVPKPMVGSGPDSSMAGLQLEAGDYAGGKFTMNRTFAALVAPHLASLNGDGRVSTEEEQEKEEDFYAALQKRIQANLKTSKDSSALFVNSYSCYDKGECCGYMKAYMTNQKLNPQDGLDEKCHYRCALAGDVPMKDWKRACGVDFCSLAPWKNQTDCCTAINDGNCPPGSLCAQICVDCVGEDGSNCPLPKCDIFLWNDFFDCKNGTFCDGSELPDGDIPGWGNVKGICKLPTCQTLSSDCNAWKVPSCCTEYWNKLASGDTPSPQAQVCGGISQKSDCCGVAVTQGFWQFQCDAAGNATAMLSNGTWYCPKPEWNKYCQVQKGCASPYVAPNALKWGQGCAATPGNLPPTPYQDPNPSGGFPSGGLGSGTTPKSPASIGAGINGSRVPTTRVGGGFGSWGGSE